jgi:histidine phosphotransferase ChpT
MAMSGMIDTDKLDLAALLGSRICHDLISPIGAIGNGLELLMIESAAQGPEMALIGESVGHANARIRFFRVAFGTASPQQRISATEVRSILSDLTRGGRLSIAWHSAADLSRVQVKVAFLMLMCLESALAYGGKITVQAEGERWQFDAQTTKLRREGPLWEMLTNPAAAPEVTPATVHFVLAAQEIARRRMALAAEYGTDWIKLSF